MLFNAMLCLCIAVQADLSDSSRSIPSAGITNVQQANEPIEETPQDLKKLRVLGNERAPYAFRDVNGKWHGIEITILENVVRLMGMELEIYPLPDQSLKEYGIDSTNADIALGAITRSSKRMEAGVPFTHSVHQSSMRIAMEWEDGYETGVGFVAVFNAFLKAMVIGFDYGHIIFVPMLIVALGWMIKLMKDEGAGYIKTGLAAFIFVSVFSTYMGSIVVNVMQYRSAEQISGVNGPEDLTHKQVACITNTPSFDEMSRWVVDPNDLIGCSSIEEMRRQVLNDDDVEFLAHEEELIAWDINQNCPGELRFTGKRFGSQFYAWIIRRDANPDAVNELNLAIAQTLEDPNIQRQIAKYLELASTDE